MRPAEPKDYDEAAWAMTRPFVRDPAVNWYGCVKEMFPEDVDARTISPHTLNTLPKEAKRVVQKLYTFQRALLEATVLAGGLVTVAVIPEPAGDGEQTPREVIAAVTLWLKPGQSMDFSVMTTIRSGLWKLFFTWGLTSVRVRTSATNYGSSCSSGSCQASHSDCRRNSGPRSSGAWRRRSRLIIWTGGIHGISFRHALILNTRAKVTSHAIIRDFLKRCSLTTSLGLCGLMMRDGFERSNPKPVHLESTTAKSRDIYAHYGFEVGPTYFDASTMPGTNPVLTRSMRSTSLGKELLMPAVSLPRVRRPLDIPNGS